MKKLLVLTLIISIFALNVCYAAGFSDVSKEHWAYDTINNMKEKGILNGYEDGTFKPDKEVTREEFVQILYKAVNSPKVETKIIVNYYDVSESRWSYNPIQYFGSSLKETSDGYSYFYPERPILREEVAVILSEAFDLTGEEKPVEFIDKIEISEKYTDAVNNVAASGLMIGNENKEFSPKKSLTRAEASTLITRFLKSTGADDPAIEDVDLDVAFLKLENAKANVIYSPLSIKYALKMLSEGALENTKQQIDHLVGAYDLTKYESSKNISLANGLYIRNDYKEMVKDSFSNTLKTKYNAEVMYDALTSAGNINKWIEDKTLGLIKNMLKDGDVAGVKLLLLNALAIDMEWDVKFSDDNTRGKEFIKQDGTKILATTLNQSCSVNKKTDFNVFGYYFDDDIQVINKDLKEYDGNQLEFVAIMPKKQSLIDFTNNITTAQINEIRNKSIDISKRTYKDDVLTEIILNIPKFKFEYDIKFEDELKKLGMEYAFDPNVANFNNISEKTQFYVDKAKHKAMIEFSEDGIKAAAVTIFAMKDSAVAIPRETEYIRINFDHPFLFIIRDKKTGEIWFVGTVYEPNLWENDKAEYYG